MKPANITKGGQITAYRFKMFNQVNMWFSFWIFSIFLIISLLGFVYFTPVEIVHNGLQFWIADFSKSLLVLNDSDSAKTFSRITGNDTLNTISMSLREVVQSKYMQYIGDQFVLRLEIFAGIGSGVACIIYFLLMKYVSGVGVKETRDEYISGMKYTENPSEINRLLDKDKKKSDLKIGKLHLVKDAEIQNFLIHGTIGTGKSTIIRYLLEYIVKRGDRFIVFDSGGTFIETHYDSERDFILNPHDERCVNWNLWQECQSVVDYENLAASLIPVEGNSDPFWVSSSRTIFSDTAMKMSREENPTIEQFLKVILSLSLKDLRTFLKNTPSANLVEEKIEKTAISIRSVTTNYAKSLRFLQGIDSGKAKFSIREWMKNPRYSSSGLFISTTAIHRDSTRPLISMWLSMATKYLQAMGEDRDRRVWFIMDEIPSLQKIPGLRDTLAEARKFGGCFILGMQNMAQMTDTYGRDNAKALFDLLNTRAYGRSPSSEQAKEVERELGNQRRWEAREQNSFGLDQVRDGISIGRDKVTQPVVDYEQVMSLPDLWFYWRLPGDYPVIKLHVPYRKLPKKAPAWIERQFTDKLSPLLEELIRFNERENAADFQPSALSGNTEQMKVTTPVPESVKPRLEAVLTKPVEHTGTPEVAATPNDTEPSHTVSATEAAERIRQIRAKRQAHNEIPPTAKPATPAPNTNTGKVRAVRRFARVQKLRKQGESEDESNTVNAELAATVYELDGKLIIRDEKPVIDEIKSTERMADEEQNILRSHQSPENDEHGEPEL